MNKESALLIVHSLVMIAAINNKCAFRMECEMLVTLDRDPLINQSFFPIER